MEVVPAAVLLLFLALAGGMAYLVLRMVKPSEPAEDAPAPLGFHQRQRMSLQEFYEAYYLKPGSTVRMNQVQAGLTMFAMAARVPAELLRPTDRLSDFGERSSGILNSILTAKFQEAIAKNPKLAGCKMETVDDLIQLACKADEEPEGEGPLYPVPPSIE